MHYYQKHIGDFNNATRHLTRVERSLYSDAIELYYETEKPLVLDFERLCKLLLAVTDEEKTALKSILSEFFTQAENGYFNKRCNEEIVKYQSFIDSRSRAGKASAEKRINTCSTRVQHNGNTRATNHKPTTNNQQPITNNQDKDISANADTCKPKKTKSEFNGIDCKNIFEYWQSVMGHPQSQMLDKRKRLIQKTLDSGYTPIQAKLAIDGHKKSKWHKENGFDGIEYSLKPENIDKFIKMAGMTDAELNRTTGKLNWDDTTWADGLQAEFGVRN